MRRNRRRDEEEGRGERGGEMRRNRRRDEER